MDFASSPFPTDGTYYDLLEIPTDASAQDVRNAYTRAKAAYSKDNPALYTMMDASEAGEMISQIEEAFQTLIDSERRRDYDARNGIVSVVERKVISIDRHPPMALGADERDILVPPSTDLPDTDGGSPFDPPPGEAASFLDSHFPSASSPFADRRRTDSPGRRATDFSPGLSGGDAMGDEIARETEWRGSFLKRVREHRRLSLDDLASQSKISKNYLHALEEENFDKLPAQVFVRGFVTQIAKILRLPSDRVAPAYMARYKRSG